MSDLSFGQGSAPVALHNDATGNPLAVGSGETTPETLRVHIGNSAAPVLIQDGDQVIINAGNGWFVPSGNVLTLSSGSQYNILIKTQSTKIIHMRDITVNVNRNNTNSTLIASLYEGATISNDGAGLTVFNNKRTVATSSDALFYSAPTITSVGTKLFDYLLHADWETYLAPSYTTKFEIILKQSTNYLLRVSNNSNQAIDFTYLLYYYEE